MKRKRTTVGRIKPEDYQDCLKLAARVSAGMTQKLTEIVFMSRKDEEDSIRMAGVSDTLQTTIDNLEVLQELLPQLEKLATKKMVAACRKKAQ